MIDLLWFRFIKDIYIISKVAPLLKIKKILESNGPFNAENDPDFLNLILFLHFLRNLPNRLYFYINRTL